MYLQVLEPLGAELGDLGPELFERQRRLGFPQLDGDQLLLQGHDHIVRRHLPQPLLVLRSITQHGLKS